MATQCEAHGPLMKEQFVSEPLRPLGATFDTGRMARGEPGLPREFIWRGRTVRIVEVRRSWKETGPCRNGSDEQYVRKHWYEAVTASHGVMKIYFERQPRGRHKTQRWWLFSLCSENTQSPVALSCCPKGPIIPISPITPISFSLGETPPHGDCEEDNGP